MALPISALLNPVPENSPSDEEASRPRNKLYLVVNAQAQVPGGQHLQRTGDANGPITPSPTDSASSQENRVHVETDTPARKKHRHDDLLTPPKSDDLQVHPEGAEHEADGIKALAATDGPQFNLFGAVINRPDLLVEFTTHLEIEDLISLYAISRDFHDQVDSRFTTVIMAQAQIKAPESAEVFHFKAYKSFCMPDPALRPHPRLPNEIRLIPSFRWLRMVLYRERAVTEIIEILAGEGLKMPARASVTLKRIWLTMDIPTNAKRIGLMHNTNFWTDVDLYLAVMFSVRLDMLFNDPDDSFPEVALRMLFLGQRSLTPLWNALKRTSFTSHIEVAQAQVRYFYNPPPRWRNVSIFGVRPSEFSTISRDATSSMRLLRIDELVLREMSRRELPRDREMVCEMILWGTLDLDELEKEGDNEDEDAWEDLPAGVAQLGMA